MNTQEAEKVRPVRLYSSGFRELSAQGTREQLAARENRGDRQTDTNRISKKKTQIDTGETELQLVLRKDNAGLTNYGTLAFIYFGRQVNCSIGYVASTVVMPAIYSVLSITVSLQYAYSFRDGMFHIHHAHFVLCTLRLVQTPNKKTRWRCYGQSVFTADLIRMTSPDTPQSIFAGYGGDPKGRYQGRLCVRQSDRQMVTSFDTEGPPPDAPPMPRQVKTKAQRPHTILSTRFSGQTPRRALRRRYADDSTQTKDIVRGLRGTHGRRAPAEVGEVWGDARG